MTASSRLGTKIVRKRSARLRREVERLERDQDRRPAAVEGRAASGSAPQHLVILDGERMAVVVVGHAPGL